jgi:hypothetical protein
MLTWYKSSSKNLKNVRLGNAQFHIANLQYTIMFIKQKKLYFN